MVDLICVLDFDFTHHHPSLNKSGALMLIYKQYNNPPLVVKGYGSVKTWQPFVIRITHFIRLHLDCDLGYQVIK